MTTIDDLELAREDLESLLLDMLASVLAEDAATVWDDLPVGTQSTARLGIHDESDDRYLGVVVRLGLPLARVLASRMMSIADPSGDDVLDAVGELGNIAGGNVKSLLCQHARLSLPAAELSDGQIEGVSDGVQVRAVVLGQVIELAVSPTITSDGLLWPPDAMTDTTETL